MIASQRQPTEEAPLGWRDGIPIDARTGRPYWLGRDPIGNADRTFVAASGVPRAWAGRDRWTVLDTDFGLGLRFVATLRRWHDDPQRPHRLFHVGLAPRPVPVATLPAALAAAGAPSGLIASLAAGWPLPLTGIHRIELDGGRVVLMIAVGDPSRLLPRLVLSADALYLSAEPVAADVLSSVAVRAACAKLRAGGVAVAHPADPVLRSAVAAAGLERCSADGDGDGDGIVAVRTRGAVPPDASPGGRRTALVVGAGIAGSAIAFGLARRGWQVTVLDESGTAASGGSGQPALAHHPSVSPDDAPLSRLTRCALLLARGAYDDGAVRWHGRLQLAAPERAARVAGALPAGWVRAVDAAEASARSGLPLRSGGLWLPLAGSVDPAALCDAWTAGPVVRRPSSRVERLLPSAEGWRAIDARGRTLCEAAVAIVAAAAGSAALVADPASIASARSPADPPRDRGWPPPLQRRPGRSTIVRPPGPPLRCVIGGDALAVPLPDGRWLLGPTESPDESAWQRLRDGFIDPASSAARRLLDWEPVPETVPIGWRISTIDHIPLIGPVPDARAIAASHARLQRDDRLPVPVLPGLWIASALGGRGLLWSVLAAEVIAARLEAEPAPLERDLLQAIDPSRFVKRVLRRTL